MDDNMVSTQRIVYFISLLILLAFSSILPITPFTPEESSLRAYSVDVKHAEQGGGQFSVQKQVDLHVVLGLSPSFGFRILNALFLQLIFLIPFVVIYQIFFIEREGNVIPLQLKLLLLEFLKYTAPYFSSLCGNKTTYKPSMNLA